MSTSGVTGADRPMGGPGDAADRLLRLTEPAYADGLSAMPDGVNPAAIARLVFDQDGAMSDPSGLNMAWVIWGQFLDHDLDLTPQQNPAEAAPGEMMLVPGLVAPVMRSIYDPSTGTWTPRAQMTVITPFVDASNVYGSDTVRADALRAFEGGRLAVSDRLGGVDLLPVNHAGLDNDGESDATGPMFLAGDVRANENPALTALHTVFLDEHNYWAGRLAADHPTWGDEALYQGARSIVEMLVQRISYEEFLPALIGEGALAALADTDRPAGIFAEFSTAAYRFGHSMVAPEMSLTGEDGTATGTPLDLASALFNNDPVRQGGIGDILRGVAETRAQTLDTKVVDPLNQFFDMGGGQMVGFSLPALNILRGRDHGLGSYLEVRAELLGDVGPDAGFDAITSDTDVQTALAAVYGTADKVDLWVGGLAEDKVEGAAVGRLFQTILVEQFTLIRDADPYWHERRDWLDEGLHAELEATSFADILMRSGGVDHIQRDVFRASDRIGGSDVHDLLTGDGGRDLMIGFAGNDRLFGLGSDDDLFGDAGNDRLFGGAGHDGLSGGDGHDFIRGGSGDDIADGGNGNDWVRGDAGNDRIEGGSGHDRLLGGAGDDTLAGGDGRDLLWGGSGADNFLFRSEDDCADTVFDFDKGADLLVFEGFDAGFADLEIRSGGPMVALLIAGDLIATVRGEVSALDESDFVFLV